MLLPLGVAFRLSALAHRHRRGVRRQRRATHHLHRPSSPEAGDDLRPSSTTRARIILCLLLLATPLLSILLVYHQFLPLLLLLAKHIHLNSSDSSTHQPNQAHSSQAVVGAITSVPRNPQPQPRTRIRGLLLLRYRRLVTLPLGDSILFLSFVLGIIRQLQLLILRHRRLRHLPFVDPILLLLPLPRSSSTRTGTRTITYVCSSFALSTYSTPRCADACMYAFMKSYIIGR